MGYFSAVVGWDVREILLYVSVSDPSFRPPSGYTERDQVEMYADWTYCTDTERARLGPVPERAQDQRLFAPSRPRGGSLCAAWTGQGVYRGSSRGD